jgi:hypothetical protein
MIKRPVREVDPPGVGDQIERAVRVHAHRSRP